MIVLMRIVKQLRSRNEQTWQRAADQSWASSVWRASGGHFVHWVGTLTVWAASVPGARAVKSQVVLGD